MTKLLLVKQTYQYSRYNRWLTCVYMAVSAFHKGTNHPRVEDNPIAERNPTIPEVRGQTKLAPNTGSGRGTIKQQAESPFDDDSCHRVLSQPGSPSKGPRSCRKFTQTFLRKGKYMQHGKFLQKAALLWIKIKIHFLYQKQEAVGHQNFWQLIGAVLFFYLGQPIHDVHDDFYSLNDFYFGALFPFLQIEQPMAVTVSCFLMIFSPFSNVFFTFQTISCHHSSLVLHLLRVPQAVSPASRRPAALPRVWLCFSGMLLLPGLAAPRLARIFSISFSADIIFCSVFFPSNQATFMAAHITCVLFRFIFFRWCIYWKFLILKREKKIKDQALTSTAGKERIWVRLVEVLFKKFTQKFVQIK